MVSKNVVEKYQMSFSNGLGEMGLGKMGRHLGGICGIDLTIAIIIK